MKRRILYVILLVLATLCFAFGGVACANSNEDNKNLSGVTLTFDDGDSITLNIGETRMLPFTSSEVLPASNHASIVSSDTSVVSTNDKGYITAVGKGTAQLTLSVEGVSVTAKIAVTVVVPEVKTEDSYYVNVDPSKHTNLFVDLGDTVPAGASLYAEAYRGSEFVGRTTVKTLPNHRAYIPLEDMNMEGGIYRLGLACIDVNDAKIDGVYLTDAVISYSFIKGEDWTFYGSEMPQNGVLHFLNETANHGGASIVLNIEEDENGTILNPYIRMRVTAGEVWSVKIRRGDGVDSRYEEVMLNDIAVAEKSVCDINLNDWANYVRGGQVTLVFYAVGDDLTVGDITNYSKNNEYDVATKANNYKPIDSIQIKVAEKLYVGQEYDLDFRVQPTNASFRQFTWTVSNDTATILDTGKIRINKAGECVLSYVGFDGQIYDSITINGLIDVKALRFETTAGQAIVAKESGTYNLANVLSVVPSTATNQSVQYALISSTSQGATVSADGVVSFTQAGTIKVKMTSKDNGNIKNEFVLTVVESLIHTESVVISGKQSDMDIDDSVTMSATVAPNNATYKDVIWQSDNEAVVTVENGTVVALKAGTATVSAFAADGASYDSVEITVHAVKEVTMNPTDYAYGSIELSSDILADDEVIVKVYRGNNEFTLIEKVITEEEKDVNGAGSMDAQRRLLFALTDSIFDGSAEYRFELLVNRNGELLQGFAFGTLVFYKQATITENTWVEGSNCAPTQDQTEMVATLLGDGYGYVARTISTSEIRNANYLLVDVSDMSVDAKVAIKILIGTNEITLTSGDCTSLGVYKFDLNAYATQISSVETIDLKIYVIGKKSDIAVVSNIVFVTEESKS